jgi:hypothetical protein
MSTYPNSLPLSKGRLWTGRIISGLMTAFLGLDAIMKFAKPEMVVKGTVELGYSESVILPLGVVLLASVILYALPRTSMWGAILLTAYLGGAVATNVRADKPLFTHVLSPVYVAVLLWVGLTLRDRTLEVLLFAKDRERA